MRELMQHKVLSLERTCDALLAAMAHRARAISPP
jgi:hypothetical protein